MSRIAPVAKATKQSAKGLKKKANLRYAASELLQTVTAVNGALQIIVVRINPGDVDSFPRLSEEAKLWQQYTFHKLRYRYEPRCSTATAGSVILSPEYDSSESRPTDEPQFTNTQDAVENASWTELVCDLDVKAMFPIGPRKYVRTEQVVDVNVYDAGILYCVTLGQGATLAVGKLWVDYDVEFFVPQYSERSDLTSTALVSYRQDIAIALATGVAEILVYNNIIGECRGLISEASGVFTLKRGVYRTQCFVDVYSSASTGCFYTLICTPGGGATSDQKNMVATFPNFAVAQSFNNQIVNSAIIYVQEDAGNFNWNITMTSAGALTYGPCVTTLEIIES